jgi:type I restriction enzyme M protein
MPPKRKASSKDQSTTNLGFEAKLWLAADKLRNNMDASEPSGARQTAAGSPKGERGRANQYKHVVLGLIFLSRAERDRSPKVTRRASRGLRVKSISDTFEEHHSKLLPNLLSGELSVATAALAF